MMTNRCSRTMRVLWSVSAGLLVAGCSDRSPPADPAEDLRVEKDADGAPFRLNLLTEILSSDDPPRFLRINEHLSVALIGRGELVEPGPDLMDPFDAPRHPRAPEVADPEEPPAHRASFGEVKIIAFNSRTRFEFEITMSEVMLRAIHRMREARGLVGASEGVDDPEAVERGNEVGDDRPRGGSVSPSGWSNAIDGRTILSPTTIYPWRTIAQLGNINGSESFCSATLIGPRHLITAAHCINPQGTNTWLTRWVTPARDGAGVRPYGSSTIQLNPPPGAEAWYFTPVQWRVPFLADAVQWDWGLIVIPDRLGDLAGWMGYVARPKSELKLLNHLNRGYPACQGSVVNRPANCQIARLYGDAACGLGPSQYKGSDGWYRIIHNGCDASPGQSGSPLYHYFYDSKLGKSVPVVSMVMVAESCKICEPATLYPNWARRITPEDLGVISWLRQAFP